MADWISPTGYEDPGNVWVNESDAYDEDTTTFSLHQSFAPGTWTNYLILTVDSASGSKLRFNVYNSNLIIKLDIYKDGAWEEVYSGNYPERIWVEKSFSVGTVSQARMKFYNNGIQSWQAAVFEFDFWGTRVPAFYEGHYTPDFDTGEFYGYADQVVKVFPKLQQYKDQVIKTLPRLTSYADKELKLTPRFQLYDDQLLKYVPGFKYFKDTVTKTLPRLLEYRDQTVKTLPQFKSYLDQLVEFLVEIKQFKDQIVKVSPKLLQYIDQTVRASVSLSSYIDSYLKLLPKLTDYSDISVKALPRFTAYSDEVVVKGVFSDVDYSSTDYDVYREEVPRQIFRVLPRFTSYVDETFKVFVQLAKYSDKIVEILPRFQKYLDNVFSFLPELELYIDQNIKVAPKLLEHADQIVKFLTELLSYKDTLIKFNPRLADVIDQVIKTLPRLQGYLDKYIELLPRLTSYSDELIVYSGAYSTDYSSSDFDADYERLPGQIFRTLPSFTGYVDKTFKVLGKLADYSDKILKTLPRFQGYVDKYIKVLPRLLAYSDELIAGAFSETDYSDTDFDVYRLPGQIFQFLPKLQEYIDKVLQFNVARMGFNDQILKTLVRLGYLTDEAIKFLPRFMAYSDEPTPIGAFSENDYSHIDYDVYRVPGQIFQFLPELITYSDELAVLGAFSTDYSHIDYDVYRVPGQIFQALPRLSNYVDSIIKLLPQFQTQLDKVLVFQPQLAGFRDSIVQTLPRLQEFNDQILKFVAEYETFEHLFIITVTRGEFDPLILLYKLLRDNWSLTDDLSQDNLTFTTGWYDSKFSTPQVSLRPLYETAVPVETGTSPTYKQAYSLLVNIWVRPKTDSGTSLGWAKSASYRIRKEVERIIKAGAYLEVEKGGSYDQFLTLRRWRVLDETDKRPVIFRTEIEVIDNFYRKS